MSCDGCSERHLDSGTVRHRGIDHRLCYGYVLAAPLRELDYERVQFLLRINDGRRDVQIFFVI